MLKNFYILPPPADYGDSGQKLYNQITGMSVKVHCIHNCMREKFEKEWEEQKCTSPFDLHPYIYLGVVECPEDNDAGPEGKIVPCVAQSSRFYPARNPNPNLTP